MVQQRTLMVAFVGAVFAVAWLAIGEPADPAVVAELVAAAGTADQHPGADLIASSIGPRATSSRAASRTSPATAC